jgi:hypothetical protein
MICIVMALPLLLPLSSLGGLLAGSSKPGRRTTPLLMAVLPFAVAPLESRWQPPVRLQDNVTQVVVDAPPAVVWEHVVRVDSITARERRPRSRSMFRTRITAGWRFLPPPVSTCSRWT